ncbi:chemotaxis protein [Rhodospirillum rubrum]|uniref:rod-binding protein n=1 Tax=Rhodospirillum rubrum TaxID=1085 RepID=UPI0019088DE0|nr:rod-binding protein [Rhodospirillum rubrum]MBK1666226.1 chemotaxis protein [Rhodospirillum rubrum]MBK1677325.1 chemotaxis protein [Rhodospirillum rubrum]
MADTSSLSSSGTDALTQASAARTRNLAMLRAKTPAEAKESAQEFESFFLGQMLQPMFSSIETEAPFGGGHAEEMWRSMMVDEYGKMIARNGGVGIADAVMRVMLANQEA